jgi:Tol biopolymer transport system component
VDSDGNIIFTDGNTDGVFCLSPSRGEVEEIVAGDSKVRFADFGPHPLDSQIILAVQEDHREKEVENRVVVIDKKSKEACVVVQGADFYSHPKFSPDGRRVSWVQWMHPDMPWTGSELYVADWKDGIVGEKTKIAGKAGEECIVSPKWLFDGSLMFASDKTGFWQVYRYDVTTNQVEQLVTEGFEDADLGAREVLLGLYVVSRFPTDHSLITLVP